MKNGPGQGSERPGRGSERPGEMLKEISSPSLPNLQALLTSRLATQLLRFPKSRSIFRQGDKSDCLMFIQSGTVKVTVVNAQGKEAVIALLVAGDFLGESCVSEGAAPRVATATAIAPTGLLVIQKSEMVRAIHEDHQVAEVFLAYVMKRNQKIESDLLDQLLNSTEKRLARALLLLAECGREVDPETAVAKVSQETLAKLVGTTRSRVNFFMSKFRKSGFIRDRAGLQINSSLRNVVLQD